MYSVCTPQQEGSRSVNGTGDAEDLEVADSGWSEVRKTRYINYITVTLTHLLIFLVLGTRGYTIVRDTINDGGEGEGEGERGRSRARC